MSGAINEKFLKFLLVFSQEVANDPHFKWELFPLKDFC